MADPQNGKTLYYKCYMNIEHILTDIRGPHERLVSDIDLLSSFGSSEFVGESEDVTD